MYACLPSSEWSSGMSTARCNGNAIRTKHSLVSHSHSLCCCSPNWLHNLTWKRLKQEKKMRVRETTVVRYPTIPIHSWHPLLLSLAFDHLLARESIYLLRYSKLGGEKKMLYMNEECRCGIQQTLIHSSRGIRFPLASTFRVWIVVGTWHPSVP